MLIFFTLEIVVIDFSGKAHFFHFRNFLDFAGRVHCFTLEMLVPDFQARIIFCQFSIFCRQVFLPHAPPLMSLLSTWMEDHLHNPPKTWSRLDAQAIFKKGDFLATIFWFKMLPCRIGQLYWNFLL